MSRLATLAVLFVSSLGCRTSPAPTPTNVPDDNGLRPAASFAGIDDPSTRAVALFNEAARVLGHPRCVNCHPADGQPRQGDASSSHEPPVWGGEDGRGVVALRCVSCHQERNYEPLTMPGAPDWHLAPPEMVFLGQSPGQICAGLKNNQRNGGMTIAEVIDHIGHDKFVAWGFAPGPDRAAPPGSQATLAGLIKAWADAGAACPEEEVGK